MLLIITNYVKLLKIVVYCDLTELQDVYEIDLKEALILLQHIIYKIFRRFLEAIGYHNELK